MHQSHTPTGRVAGPVPLGLTEAIGLTHRGEGGGHAAPRTLERAMAKKAQPVVMRKRESNTITIKAGKTAMGHQPHRNTLDVSLTEIAGRNRQSPPVSSGVGDLQEGSPAISVKENAINAGVPPATHQ